MNSSYTETYWKWRGIPTRLETSAEDNGEQTVGYPLVESNTTSAQCQRPTDREVLVRDTRPCNQEDAQDGQREDSNL